MKKIKKKPKKIALLTDSCSDMPVGKALTKGIYVVPLRIICDNTEYLDSVNIFNEDIYDFQEKGKTLKTSLPSGNAVINTLDRIAADGYDGVIAVTLSSGLSGTYNFVKMLANERTDISIEVFDSRNASLGLAMILLQLSDDIKNGANWNELINNRVPYLIENTFSFFSVDSLEYLYKGGRIGYVTAVAGSLLNVKPIITFSDDGKLKTVAKVRGNLHLVDKLTELVCEKCGSHTKFNLAAANGGMPQEMKKLKKKLTLTMPKYNEIWLGEIGGTLSVHIGKGMLGAAVQILE